MKLRKMIRKELKPEDYRTYARPLVRAIFDKGAVSRMMKFNPNGGKE